MKIFLAGAGGAIGRRLTPLLRATGHTVVGTTRSKDKAAAIEALGAEPVVVDVFDAETLARAVKAAAPQVLMHQLTDLPFAPGTPRYDEGLERNARLRIEGTRNLADAAKAAGVRRMITQSIAFVYAPADGTRAEADPLDVTATGARKRAVDGVVALEQATLELPEGIVLRYGYLYGPGTWYPNEKRAKPALHVDAAAQAALLAVSKGTPGIYNIAEDDGAISSEKAKRELGFDAGFRVQIEPSFRGALKREPGIRSPWTVRVLNSGSRAARGPGMTLRLERLAQKRRGLQAIAPRFLRGFGDSDPHAGRDLGSAGARAQFERRAVERQAVLLSRNAQRFA